MTYNVQCMCFLVCNIECSFIFCLLFVLFLKCENHLTSALALEENPGTTSEMEFLAIVVSCLALLVFLVKSSVLDVTGIHL